MRSESQCSIHCSQPVDRLSAINPMITRVFDKYSPKFSCSKSQLGITIVIHSSLVFENICSLTTNLTALNVVITMSSISCLLKY